MNREFQTKNAMGTVVEDSQPPAVRRTESILWTGVILVLLFGPLAFGAFQEWAIMTQQLAASALVLLWIRRSLWQREGVFHGNTLYLPLGCFALTVLAQIAFHQTAYAYATIQAGMQGLVYLLIVFLMTESAQSAHRLQSLAQVLSVFGFILALASILTSFTSPRLIFGFHSVRVAGQIYGPYVNHNHYAGLMEMLTPFPLLLAFYKKLPQRQRTIWTVAAVVMGTSIFLSNSRSGMAVFAVQLFFFSALIFLTNRNTRMRAAVFLMLFAVVSLAIGFSSVTVLQQLASAEYLEVSAATRLHIAQDSLHMFAARPLLGWGWGTFTTVYPQFRSFYGVEFVNAAHNDYLQLLAESGIAGFAAALWFVITLYRKSWNWLQQWETDMNSAVRVSSLLGVTGVLLHSLSDFNLHVPANAAIFVALSAVCTASGKDLTLRKKWKLSVACLSVLLLVALCFWSVRLYWAVRLNQQNDKASLERSAQLVPADAGTWRKLGNLRFFAENDAQGAIPIYKHALELNPHDAMTWLELTMTYQAIGSTIQHDDAIEHALLASPTRSEVLWQAASSYFAEGKEEQGLHLLGTLAQHDTVFLYRALDLAWRATHDVNRVLSEVAPARTDAYQSLLEILLQEEQTAPAMQVWERLRDLRQPFQATYSFPFLQYLLNQNEALDAKQVWKDLAVMDPKLVAYQPGENLVVNPGFELNILNNGLDWRYLSSQSIALSLDVSVAHSGRRSLEVAMDGAVNGSPFYQYIPVETASSYQFSGFYKVGEMEGAGGLEWAAMDAANGKILYSTPPMSETGDWQSIQGEFKTDASTRIVMLRLIRDPAGAVLRGRVWLDDLRLVKK